MAVAGEWIKWTKGLTRKREIVAIASMLQLDRRIVACCCMELWEWADDNTINGHVPSVTKTFLDELVCVTGFGGALQKVGWLECCEEPENESITFVNFERHNGKPGKHRALASDRKRKQREKVSRSERDKSVTREEKRREEKSITLPPLIPPSLDQPKFRKAWESYVELRRRKRWGPWSDKTVERRFEQFAKAGVDAAVAAIQYSLDNEFQGIFLERFANGGQRQQPNRQARLRGEYRPDDSE